MTTDPSTPSVPVLRSEAAGEMAAFAASDAACYRYPSEHEQPLRVAYCEGAASMVEALQAAERERNAAVKDYGDNLVELAEAYHQLKAAAADKERLAAALRELQQRGKTRCNGYSRCCSEFYHAADVERVLALLPTPTPTVGSSPARRDGDG